MGNPIAAFLYYNQKKNLENLRFVCDTLDCF